MQAVISVVLFLLGGGLGYFLTRRGLQAQSDIRCMQMQQLEKDLLQIKDVLRDREVKIDQMQQSLRQEAETRAAAEEKARQTQALKQENLETRSRLDELMMKFSNLQTQKAETEAKLLAEKESLLAQKLHVEETALKMTESFKALSSDTLKENNQVFLDLAKQSLLQFNQMAQGDLERRQIAIDSTVKPIFATLEKFDNKISELEMARVEAYSSIRVSVDEMGRSQDRLKQETQNLVRALRTPHVKGRWGEIQLKRVVEMAGMVEHCDFIEQPSTDSEEGRLRPDLVVRLPGGKNIVVDSKAVITAYIESAQTDNEDEKRSRLQDHARHIRSRVAELSKKSYWDQFQNSPEFVLLFLPGESFFSAALEIDPGLIEHAVEQRVIIATPTTLIALLKAVSYGWKQTALAENAQIISQLGKELYKRILTMTNYFEKVGSSLGSAVDQYNKAMGSLETRVLVSARQFKDMKVSDEEIKILTPVENIPRQIPAELRGIESDSTI